MQERNELLIKETSNNPDYLSGKIKLPALATQTLY